MYGNKATVVCIDNWSEYGGPRDEFLANFTKYTGENTATCIDDDCFSVDVSTIPKCNMFMYDGFHSPVAHYNALTYFYDCFDDVFIYIADDWNWHDTRSGTLGSIRDLNLTVLYENEIRLTWDNSHTPLEQARNTWWNGMYVVVLQKPSPQQPSAEPSADPSADPSTEPSTEPSAE
jgi:hypothetical protein